jgi:uncharacterized protein (TIGR02391 family)
LNIETKITVPLWKAIESSYSSQNFTVAIIDSIFYLSNIIRERTGLETDGVALVGNAFGGKNPKLKVNKLQTESDRNIQSGVEQLLRGLYQGIRNPRSHEKFQDDKDDADSIILFVNYLLKIISTSKSTFTKSSFLNKVFDPYFPENKRYSKLLVSEIPAKHCLDILIETFRGKNKGEPIKLRVFFEELLKNITADEKAQIIEIISEELEQVTDENSICQAIQILPIDTWKGLKEIVRIRIEHILIQSIESGKYNTKRNTCNSGWLGTWADNLLNDFILKEDVLNILITKLGSENSFESNYIFQHFFKSLIVLAQDADDWFQDWSLLVINDGLKNGDLRFYTALRSKKHLLNDKFKKEIQENFDNFKTKDDVLVPDDDLPF